MNRLFIDEHACICLTYYYTGSNSQVTKQSTGLIDRLIDKKCVQNVSGWKKKSMYFK